MIVEINYERTFNTGNYSSEKIGARLTIRETDDPDKELMALAEWVEERAKATARRRTERQRPPTDDDNEMPL